jgi:hypothetical protein
MWFEFPSPDVHIRSIREKYPPDLEVFMSQRFMQGAVQARGLRIGISPMIQEGLATFGRPLIDAKCSDVRFVS